VLSNDVAVALKNLPDSHKYEATQNLCYWTDRLFDCLNVRSYAQARRKCKADLYPYTSVGNSRFPLMLSTGVLDAWSTLMHGRHGYGNSLVKLKDVNLF